MRTSIAIQTVLKAFTWLISDDKLFHVLSNNSIREGSLTCLSFK